jgi:membrane protein DedA with SNARE-associated domain
MFIIVFFVALFESTPIIGTFTPGTLFMLFFGYMASVQDMNMALVILSATIGSIVGDVLGYIFGRYAGVWMVNHKKILKIGHIEQGRGFFSKHGGKSILIGRFVGPIRPMVPLIAGSMHMRFNTFIFWNILGGFLWSTLYITLGFFFGAYAHNIEKIVSRTGLLLVVIGVCVGVWYYIKKTKRIEICEKKNHLS